MTALNRDLPPILQAQPQSPPFQFVVHARYNPEQLTVLNIVPVRRVTPRRPLP